MQNERLAIEIPSLLSQLHSHQPTDLEEKFAEEIKRNLKGLASKVMDLFKTYRYHADH